MFRTHDRARAFLAASLSALLLWTPLTPALAAEGEIERTVVLVELREGMEGNSLSIDYLRETAKALAEAASGDFIVVPTDKVVERVGGNRQQVPTALTDERRASLDEARKKGVEYLDKADAANAIKALRAAEAKYRAAIAAPGADEALRRAYLDVLAQLATAHKIANDNDAAREVFRTVITTFGATAPITDNDYRPDVVAIFQSVVGEMKKMPQGSVEVSSSPAGARVLVGGIDRGETPAQVQNLIPGLYSVRAVQGAATSLLHRVRVEAGKATKLSIEIPFESHLVLEDANVSLSYKDMDEARARMSSDGLAIGKAMDVNVVAVIGVVDRKLQAFLIDVATGKVRQPTATSVPQIGVSKRAVARVAQAITGKGDVPPPEEAQQPWYTSVPGLALGGAGLLSLVVGLTFSGSLGNITIFPCETDTTLDKSQCPTGKYGTTNGQIAAQLAKGDIYSDRTIAGVGIGLGAALLAGSAVMFYLHSLGGAGAEEAALLQGRDGVLTLPPASFGSARTVFIAAP